ncbi:MAG: DUF2017 family protein [Acidimicrobiales bacterium]
MNQARRIRPNRHGGFDLKLPPVERQLLQSLPGQLEPILALGSDDLRRLYPPAYSDDPKRQAEYDQLMRADLIEHHRHALSVLAATAGSKQITEDELSIWLKAINTLRLVLGTRLGVTEDMALVGPGDPRAPGLSVYHYLSFLQEQGTEALSTSLS